MEYNLKPRRRCHPARTGVAAELAVTHDPASRGSAMAAQNGVEEPNVNGTRLSNSALVTPARTRCSAMLNVGATVVDLMRIKIQKQSASVIDMLTEFATNELEDMEGELAGRSNSLTQQQEM